MFKRASVDVGAGVASDSNSHSASGGPVKSKFLKRLSSASSDTVTTQNSRLSTSYPIAERSSSMDERRMNEPLTPNGAEPDTDQERDHTSLKSIWKRAVQSLRRKDGKHEETDSFPTKDVPISNDVDPIYSILKVSAVLPRQGSIIEGHGCCTVGPDGNTISITPANIHRGQGGVSCACPCHNPELLDGYHSEWMKSFIPKK